MAAITVPKPGTEFGPCNTTRGPNGVVLTCGHLDCKASREQASALCGGCGRKIGYETPWVMDNHQPFHRGCVK